MTYPMDRCGFLVQRSVHVYTDEVLYRVSKDGWVRYVPGDQWDEIGLDDDAVFGPLATSWYTFAAWERG